MRAGRQRRLHKAFRRYHDPEYWPLLREALQRIGRADLVGNGKKHLIPSFQPAGTGKTLQRANSLQPKNCIAPVRRAVVPAKSGGKPKRAIRRTAP